MANEQDMNLIWRGRCEQKQDISLLSKMRYLALSSDQKLMLKYNVVNNDGSLTRTGEEMLLDILLTKNKQAIIDELKKLDKFDPNNKK